MALLLQRAVSAVRPHLLRHVEAGSDTVAYFQRVCGVPRATRETTEQDERDRDSNAPKRGYLLLHVVFTLGAALGNELFYILALPLLFWQLDDTVGRETILLWSGVYYVGQALKDVLQLPRPRHGHRGVVRLEAHYEAEYGAPSTHAMCAFSLPWFVAWLGHGRWDLHPDHAWVPWAVAATYCVIMTLSRLYMGVHSPLDIVMGATLGLIHLCISVTWGRQIDLAQLALPWTPLVVPAASVLLSVLYPRPRKWVNSPGDTILILGVATGVCVASWAGLHTAVAPQGATGAWIAPPAPQICLWCAIHPATALVRLAIGYIVLFLTRAVVKAAGFAVLQALLPPSRDPPGRRYAIELPTKWLTYSAIGFNAVYVVPRLLLWCGFPKYSVQA